MQHAVGVGIQDGVVFNRFVAGQAHDGFVARWVGHAVFALHGGIGHEFEGVYLGRTLTPALSQGEREQKQAEWELKVGQTVLRVNPRFYRPAEVELLIGNPAKAKAQLGWEPKTTLEQLCQMMVNEDVRRNRQGFSF